MDPIARVSPVKGTISAIGGSGSARAFPGGCQVNRSTSKDTSPSWASDKSLSPLGDEGLEGFPPMDKVFCNVGGGQKGVTSPGKGLPCISPDSEEESEENRDIEVEDLVYRQALIDKTMADQRLESIQKMRSLRQEKGKEVARVQQEVKDKGKNIYKTGGQRDSTVFVPRAIQERRSFKPPQGVRGGGRGGGRLPFRGQRGHRSFTEVTREGSDDDNRGSGEESQEAPHLFDHTQQKKSWASVVAEKKPRGAGLEFIPQDAESILEIESLLGSDDYTDSASEETIQKAIHNKLSQQSVDAMSKEVTEEEIRSAMWSLPANKAPGPDGSRLSGFALWFCCCLAAWIHFQCLIPASAAVAWAGSAHCCGLVDCWALRWCSSWLPNSSQLLLDCWALPAVLLSGCCGSRRAAVVSVLLLGCLLLVLRLHFVLCSDLLLCFLGCIDAMVGMWLTSCWFAFCCCSSRFCCLPGHVAEVLWFFVFLGLVARLILV
ncbi:hypothetical protein U1Q18_037937 [Sarracenia purpurea var. burkii]